MTLHKSIEAAREAIGKIGIVLSGDGIRWVGIEELISTLPAQPMTEEEIIEVIAAQCNYARCHSTRTIGNIELAQSIVKSLRDKGVLYVEEK